MADTRKRPGWLLCAKLAVIFEISIWLESRKPLDIFAVRAEVKISSHYGECVHFAIY